jgi:hypothetical protein
MVLETIYKQDFLDSSYGFRPGRSVHQALDALWQRTMAMRAAGSWTWTFVSFSIRLTTAICETS